MKAEDIRAMGTEELKKNIDRAHQELFNLRIRLATRQLVNHREIPKTKRKIAQLETILREKELASR